jgi:hypothetical protein
MKTLKKLGLQLKTPSITSVGGYAADGKTTLLIAIAKDFLDEGKSVAIVSQDNYKIWTNRLAYYGDSSTNAKFFHLPKGVTVTERLGNDKFDCLIVDVISFEPEKLMTEIRDLAISRNMSTFTSFNLLRSFNNDIHSLSQTKVLKSDFIVTITRKNEYYQSLFDRIKSILFPFWFKKPNRTINLLKNRYGTLLTRDINVDFKRAELV